MASLNKAILIGRLGKDVDLKYTPSGTSVASFSIATTEKWTDKQGQKQESTTWHNIVLWNKLADLAGKYLKKGSEVYIEGKITSRSWDDRDGNKRYITEIVGSSMQFIGGKKEEKDHSVPDNNAAVTNIVQTEEDGLPF